MVFVPCISMLLLDAGVILVPHMMITIGTLSRGGVVLDVQDLYYLKLFLDTS